MKLSIFAKLTFAALIAGNGANALDKKEATKQFKEAFEEYADCYFKTYKFTEDDLFNQMNNMCIIYDSEKCQQFYKSMLETHVLPGCEEWQENVYGDKDYEIPIYSTFVVHDTDYLQTIMKLLCEYDNNGDFCPIARNIAIGNGHNGDEMLLDNCRHYACTNTYVELINYEVTFGNIPKDVLHAYEFLKTEECANEYYKNEQAIEDRKKALENNGDASTSVTAVDEPTTTKYNVPTSTEKGRCGPDFGACAKSNECCSKYGWCGTTEAHCGTGCQSEFGVCNQNTSPTSTTEKTTTTKTNAPTSTEKGRCGPDFGACAKSNECCSKYGWCGTSEKHCGTGCQSEFGVCNKKTTTTEATTTKATTTKTSSEIPTSTEKGRCGPNYGACAKSGYCCSKHNYCGNTGDYCGTGCQNKYGICW